MNTFLGLLAIFALIASNAWFVAAEFGYVAVRRHRLEEAEAAGDASAKRALSVLGRVGFMLSGAQFGITATSLVLGFIAEPVLEQLFRPLFETIGLPGRRGQRCRQPSPSWWRSSPRWCWGSWRRRTMRSPNRSASPSARPAA
jgi:CBS domain containing-hemolysin-like protein